MELHLTEEWPAKNISKGLDNMETHIQIRLDQINTNLKEDFSRIFLGERTLQCNMIMTLYWR
jgi:hypothetical protein